MSDLNILLGLAIAFNIGVGLTLLIEIINLVIKIIKKEKEK